MKHDLAEGGLPARFTQAAQAELLHAVEETPAGPRLRLAGGLHPIPEFCRLLRAAGVGRNPRLAVPQGVRAPGPGAPEAA